MRLLMGSMGWFGFAVFLLSLSHCYELVFIVLGYNRPDELRKTLHNLCRLKSDKRYRITIHIDGPTERNVALVTESLSVAQQFNCPLYNLTVMAHQSNRGIMGQWMEAWDPMDNQYALIIEDDVELSRDTLYHLDGLIENFKDDPDLYGIALQRAQWQLGICERRRWRRLDLVGEEEHPPFFKYPALGTWGQLLFPKPWSRFLASAKREEDGSVLEGLVTEGWAKRGRRLISPVFTRWALGTGRLNLYANFGVGRAMARSRQPPGTNAQATHHPVKLDAFPSPLEIRRKLELVKKARKMSACFDPIDLTVSEHTFQYGIIVSVPQGMTWIERKAVGCSLAAHRIYPMSPTDLLPRLEIYCAGGYFKLSPLELISSSSSELMNIEYSTSGNHTVMKLIRNHGPATIQMLTEEDYEVGLTMNEQGICSRFYCPFVPGLYPDKPIGLEEYTEDRTELRFVDL